MPNIIVPFNVTFNHCVYNFQSKDQLRHSQLSDQPLSEAYSRREHENLDRIETVICDHDQVTSRLNGTGAKAKKHNFRGSTVSEGSSGNVGLLRGAAFGLQQEFMQLKNSLLEGKNHLTENAKQKRKR